MPVSPPLSNKGEIYPHNLHHLVDHNAAASYPQDFDDGMQMGSRYGSPMPADAYGYRGQPQARFGYQQPQSNVGLGIQYVSVLQL